MDCDVHTELRNEGKVSQPSFIQRSEEVLPTIPGKSWRFVGEMEEDMKLCESHNLHHNFHSAAIEVFERLAEHKNKPPGSVSLLQMVASLKHWSPINNGGSISISSNSSSSNSISSSSGTN